MTTPSTEANSNPGDTLRQDLQRVMWAWFFGALWVYVISGALLVEFSRELGMPDWGFGLLASLPFLGTLLQIPGSYVIERWGHRKSLFLVSTTISRMFWVLAAGIPILVGGPITESWPWLLLAVGLSWGFCHLAAPAWTSWMADLIPRRLRGRFFGQRARLGQIVGLVTTLAISGLLDLASRADDAGDSGSFMLRLTSAVLALAGLLGVLDILLFRKVRDAQAAKPRLRIHWREAFRTPLHNPAFRWYLAYNFTLTLAIGFMGQYIWLFVLGPMNLSYTVAHLVLVIVPTITLVLTYSVWGAIVDRVGKKSVLVVAGAVVTIGSLGWIFIGPQGHWWWYLLVLGVTACWPGVEIANLNMLLDFSSSKHRGAGPAYVALNGVAASLGGVLSGLIAAGFAKWAHDVNLFLPLVNVTLTYHGLLFIFSTAGRLAALLISLRLVEPAATGTRETIHFITVSFYSNFVQAVLLPTRIVGQLSRWSYRLSDASARRSFRRNQLSQKPFNKTSRRGPTEP